MSWIEEFTIAVIEENPEKIGTLMLSIPNFHNINTAKHALALIKEALVIVEKGKNETADVMHKIKRTKEFLLSSPNTNNYQFIF